MKSQRDPMVALLIQGSHARKKGVKAAPRVSTEYNPQEEDLDPRARAAQEMKLEIEKLIKALGKGDSDGGIEL